MLIIGTLYIYWVKYYPNFPNLIKFNFENAECKPF